METDRKNLLKKKQNSRDEDDKIDVLQRAEAKLKAKLKKAWKRRRQHAWYIDKYHNNVGPKNENKKKLPLKGKGLKVGKDKMLKKPTQEDSNNKESEPTQQHKGDAHSNINMKTFNQTPLINKNKNTKHLKLKGSGKEKGPNKSSFPIISKTKSNGGIKKVGQKVAPSGIKVFGNQVVKPVKEFNGLKNAKNMKLVSKGKAKAQSAQNSKKSIIPIISKLRKKIQATKGKFNLKNVKKGKITNYKNGKKATHKGKSKNKQLGALKRGKAIKQWRKGKHVKSKWGKGKKYKKGKQTNKHNQVRFQEKHGNIRKMQTKGMKRKNGKTFPSGKGAKTPQTNTNIKQNKNGKIAKMATRKGQQRKKSMLNKKRISKGNKFLKGKRFQKNRRGNKKNTKWARKGKKARKLNRGNPIKKGNKLWNPNLVRRNNRNGKKQLRNQNNVPLKQQ